MSGEIDEIVKKYSEVFQDKDMKFEKINILLPNFIYDVFDRLSNDVEQVRMNNGILTTKIIDLYFEHIKTLYEIDPSKYEKDRLKYARRQLGASIIPETSDKINTIKQLIGTNDRAGVVKNAIEYYIRISQLDMTNESGIEEVDQNV